MRRIGLVLALGLTLAPLAIEAQQTGKVFRVGTLHLLPPETSQGFAALRQGLRDLGYLEGQNVVVEHRWSNKTERLSGSVTELLQLKVDISVAAEERTAAAAKRVTSDIPIVMASSADPVAAGLVASLAHPGGNVTGLSSLGSELSGKRLELLKETLPSVSRIAVLWNLGSATSLKVTEQAAQRLQVDLQRIEVSGSDDIDHAFQAAVKGRAGAVLVLPGPEFFRIRARIAELGLKHRLPTLSGEDDFAKAGGLVQYGASITENWRHAAKYVDKILKGAKPADLPVEKATKFELMINLKTAQALGLTIPQSVLLRADHLIE